MSYRVFARKYRPQTFDQVVGQGHITRTLQNAISSNRLAQAYLFVGPRGIGKTSTARILAKALNCVNGPTISPCGVCDACREIAEGNSLDVLEIDGASNNSVEHIRELRENAAFAPARGPFKIYLVDEVHMLSTAAFNALLKTLEEPPPHVKFIFATTESQKVPATITSRCQRFDLRRIPAELIAGHLQAIAQNEGITLEDEAAMAVAKGADGGLRDAESMLDQLVAFCGDRIVADDVLTVFGFTSRETVDSLTHAVFQMDAPTALRIVAEQSEAGKDLSRLMGDLIGKIRDLLVVSTHGGPATDSPPLEKLLVLLDHFAEAESRLRWAADKRLYFDVAIIKAIHLLDQTSLSDVIDTLAAIGEGRDVAPRATPRKLAELPGPAPVSEPPHKPLAAPAPLPKAEPQPAPAPTIDPEPILTPPSITAAPEPPPITEPPAVEPSAPPVPTSVREEPETPPSSLGDTWREIVEHLVSESTIRFGWLVRSEFLAHEGDKFRVQFPTSFAENTQDFFYLDLKKQVEEQLSQRLGHKVTFSPDFSGPEPPPEIEPEPEPAEDLPPSAKSPTPEKPSEPGDSRTTISLEEFKDDPKIKKALEIFKARLETKSA